MRNYRRNNENNVSELDCYIKEIIKYPLLTKEEEEELGYRILKGDKEAIDKMFFSNLRLAFSYAKKYYNSRFNHKMDIFDFINEANIGLYEACKRYDVRNRVCFSTYAEFYMKKYINDALFKQTNDSVMYHKLYYKIKEFKERRDNLEKELGRSLSYRELAQHLNYSLDDVMTYSLYLDEPISINTPIVNYEGSEGNFEIADTIVDDGKSVDEKIVDKEFSEIVNYILNNCLKDKERDVILLSEYFLNEKISLQEMSTRLGYNVTRQRVQQIKKKALEKIKEAALSYGLDDYLEIKKTI